ncbi:MAG: hypothetical protein ACRDKS_06935, partial [Actinomycetota bacterium]
AYHLQRRLGDLYQIPTTILRLSRALAGMERPEVAARLLSCFEALSAEMGASSPWRTKMKEETLAAIRPHLDERALGEATEQGRTLTADEAVGLALESLTDDAT